MDSLHSLLVVSAPSGAGKTTLVRHLLKHDSEILLSISTTTRAPRHNEKEGEDYFFVDCPTFEQMLSEKAFVEFAKVHDHFYGTSRKWLNAALQKQDVLLEIDVQGARQIKAVFPHAVLIFIMPPSLDVLAHRLKNRATDSANVIEKRLNAAKGEMRQVEIFDYVIINNDLATAVKELQAVVLAQRCRMRIQKKRHVDLFSC